jgi:hypothetical protein
MIEQKAIMIPRRVPGARRSIAGTMLAEHRLMNRLTRFPAKTVGVLPALCAVFAAPAWGQTGAPADQPTPANQPTPAHVPWTRQIAVEGQIGSATPLGIFGVALDAEVLPWLSVSAGIGADMFDRDDDYTCQCHWSLRQVALMPRLRRPIFGGNTFGSVGVGLSRNAQPDVGGQHSPLVRQDDELALEHRFADGVRARAFTGIGFSLNQPHLPPFSGSIYFGVALGYAVVPGPDRSTVPSGWYGWQPLIGDIGAAILAGAGYRSPQTVRGAFAVYLLPGPIIHVAHRRDARAVVSAALRGLLPYLFWTTFAKRNPDGGYEIEPASALVAGAVTAAVVDDLFLSWN